MLEPKGLSVWSTDARSFSSRRSMLRSCQHKHLQRWCLDKLDRVWQLKEHVVLACQENKLPAYHHLHMAVYRSCKRRL